MNARFSMLAARSSYRAIEPNDVDTAIAIHTDGEEVCLRIAPACIKMEP